MFLDWILRRRPRKRVTERLNTVDLHGDLDDVEIPVDVERQFSISINDAEAEATVTVGQLYGLIQENIAKNEGFDPVWELMVRIIRDHSNSQDPIDCETTFFAQHAKKR